GAYSAIGNYTYGYNGMEKDDELKGSGKLYSTLFREGDTENGRWWSRDPEEVQLVGLSPYTMMGGNPINLVDPLGDIHQPYNGEEIVVTAETPEPSSSTDSEVRYLDDINWTVGGRHEPIGNIDGFIIYARKYEDGDVAEFYVGYGKDDPVFTMGSKGLKQFVQNTDYYYQQLTLLNWITDDRVLQGKIFSDPENLDNLWEVYKNELFSAQNWLYGIGGFFTSGGGRFIRKTINGRNVSSVNLKGTRNSGEYSATIKFDDGGIMNIKTKRVKEFEIVNHPDAPPGTMNKVKFKDAINTDRTKRKPYDEELLILDKEIKKKR
ncbi:MAG: RHS repeat-associated core domain-containing protein, partial [Candidatus Kapaibacterium sp.]